MPASTEHNHHHNDARRVHHDHDPLAKSGSAPGIGTRPVPGALFESCAIRRGLVVQSADRRNSTAYGQAASGQVVPSSFLTLKVTASFGFGVAVPVLPQYSSPVPIAKFVA